MALSSPLTKKPPVPTTPPEEAGYDLPSFIKQFVSSEAPQSHVGPGEVAQPYEMLGDSLQKLGAGASRGPPQLAEEGR